MTNYFPLSASAAGVRVTLLACGLLLTATVEAVPFGPMQHVSLADPALGFANAMSLPIPADWKFEGRIVRDVACSPGDAFPQMQASSADGAYGLTVMTPFFTTSQPTDFDLRTCGVVAPLTSAANVLVRYVLPAIRRGAQTSAPEPVPDGERFVKSVSRQANGVIVSGDAARVRVSYTQNGRPVEEYVVGFTTQIRRAGWTGGTSSTAVQVLRAPGGKLDEFVKQVAANMQAELNPAWQQRNQQLLQQSARQAELHGEQQRAAITQTGQDAGAAGRAALANTRNQIRATGQASMDNAARSEAARHASAVGTADYVGGRPTSTYVFCNGSGATRTNNNPNPPAPGWTLCR